MVDYIAWPSLFLARPNKAQQDYTHRKRFLQPPKRSGISSWPTQAAAIGKLGISSSEDKRKNGGTLATQAVSSDFINSSYQNTSSSKVTVTTITTRPKFPAPSMILDIYSDSNDSASFFVSLNTVGKATNSGTELSISEPTLSVISQGQQSVTLPPLYVASTSYPSHGLNSNSTRATTNSNSISNHRDSSFTVKSTPPRLSFASLIITESSSPTSNNFVSENKTTSLSSLPLESIISTQITSTPTTPTEDVGNREIVEPTNQTPTSTERSHYSSYHSSETPLVIGGVMGSIAGTAIFIFLIITFLRWHKNNKWMVPLDNDDTPGIAEASPSASPALPSSDMVQQRLHPFSMSAALASLSASSKWSPKTSRTASPTDTSEKGFYRVAGRKLPSVLQYGGDGYGGNEQRYNSTSRSSTFGDSQVFNGDSANKSRSTHVGTITRESGIPFKQPSSSLNSVIEPQLLNPSLLKPPQRPDSIGRSRPSMDSSLTSRFTEEV
ncbi:hypothetical protein GcC1_016007 [Golovinomyces cichoracearum]|uniref:Uncharacterized protein n=1 Tax=Golovinomyces cichoracearum TaxID=62708 RepID=A0A420J6C8_9PEZI|nr:hypothetical protein GcC1_016007 [Golovinomyces cichoracearum]